MAAAVLCCRLNEEHVVGLKRSRHTGKQSMWTALDGQNSSKLQGGNTSGSPWRMRNTEMGEVTGAAQLTTSQKEAICWEEQWAERRPNRSKVEQKYGTKQNKYRTQTIGERKTVSMKATTKWRLNYISWVKKWWWLEENNKINRLKWNE